MFRVKVSGLKEKKKEFPCPRGSNGVFTLPPATIFFFFKGQKTGVGSGGLLFKTLNIKR